MILGGGLPGKVGGCQLLKFKQETQFLAKLSAKQITFGRLAQLGERLPYKQDVIGSSPIVSTTKSQLKWLALFCC